MEANLVRSGCPNAEQTIAVASPADMGAARRVAKAMAVVIGFDEQAAEEIVIAVSELASNLVQHARGGTLTLTPLADGTRAGIAITSTDTGPGMADVEQALTDGFSTQSGSLGCGLGAVNRLMDTLEITSQRGRSTHIMCKRWLRLAVPRLMPCPLAFGVATRAHPKMQVNGDAFVIKQWGESTLVAVIDGLGHGLPAHRAAQTARQYVESHCDQPLEMIFQGVGRACRATHGVVMSLVRFDFGLPNGNGGDTQSLAHQALDREPTRPSSADAVGHPLSTIRLTCASIGNVEGRMLAGKKLMHFVIRRGVLGLNAPKPVVTEHRWEPGNVLVLYSDGLRGHWQWADFPQLAAASATVTAQRLLDLLARDDDDATVVVVREAGYEH